MVLHVDGHLVHRARRGIAPLIKDTQEVQVEMLNGPAECLELLAAGRAIGLQWIPARSPESIGLEPRGLDEKPGPPCSISGRRSSRSGLPSVLERLSCRRIEVRVVQVLRLMGVPATGQQGVAQGRTSWRTWHPRMMICHHRRLLISVSNGPRPRISPSRCWPIFWAMRMTTPLRIQAAWRLYRPCGDI